MCIALSKTLRVAEIGWNSRLLLFFPHDLDYIPAMAEMILSPGNNSDRVALPPPPHTPNKRKKKNKSRGTRVNSSLSPVGPLTVSVGGLSLASWCADGSSLSHAPFFRNFLFLKTTKTNIAGLIK
jgi:hypothetical protein